MILLKLVHLKLLESRLIEMYNMYVYVVQRSHDNLSILLGVYKALTNINFNIHCISIYKYIPN